MAVEALKAAQIMERKGIHLEIINIKTLSPLDVKPIIESVRKTKRCIVADYDWTFCGYSAEVTSQVYNALYNQLLAPIERLGFQHVPCPTTRPLENLFYASSHDIVKAAEKLLGIDSIDLSQETQYSHEIRFKGPF
jgi:pyruvate dehydrogenase E1 component beta subunit